MHATTVKEKKDHELENIHEVVYVVWSEEE